MIGFNGTSLEPQLIITAHTLNASWSSLWRIPPKNLSLTSDCLERRLSEECSEERERESHSYLRLRFTANQFVLATSPLRPKSRIFIFQLNTCGYSPYATSTLTRGWVCRLQLLLVLASAVILRSEYRGTHDHILLSQIRHSPNLEGQIPVFISLRNRVPFSSPPATSRATVEVFDPASKRDNALKSLHGSLYRLAHIHGNSCKWFAVTATGAS
jgi:hypothetical protein